jgi:hypothetical protein
MGQALLGDLSGVSRIDEPGEGLKDVRTLPAGSINNHQAGAASSAASGRDAPPPDQQALVFHQGLSPALPSSFPGRSGS